MAGVEQLVVRAFPRGAGKLFRCFRTRQGGSSGFDRGLAFPRRFFSRAFLPPVGPGSFFVRQS
jgi:hypothetical protein